MRPRETPEHDTPARLAPCFSLAAADINRCPFSRRGAWGRLLLAHVQFQQAHNVAGQLAAIPNVLLEARAHRLPIVAPLIGGIGELIKEATGWPVCNPYDAREYAERLREALEAPAAAVARSDALADLIAQRHSFQAFCRSVSRSWLRHAKDAAPAVKAVEILAPDLDAGDAALAYPAKSAASTSNALRAVRTLQAMGLLRGRVFLRVAGARLFSRIRLFFQDEARIGQKGRVPLLHLFLSLSQILSAEHIGRTSG